MLRFGLSLLLLGLAGCGAGPGTFPPPPQRVSAGFPDPGALTDSVRMDEASAAEYIVRDVGDEQSPWRWAFARPEFKLIPKTSRKLKLWMEITIPGVTYKVTGPVTVTGFVGGRPVGSMRFAAQGRHRFERPVPDGWVEPGEAVVVAAEADKRWVSKDDGAQLSFLVHAVGLTQ